MNEIVVRKPGASGVTLEHNWLPQLPAELRAYLRDDAQDLVAGYVLRNRGADGGFLGRDGNSDPYYTVFGMECLRWLNRDDAVEPTREYVDRLASDAPADFVHRACIARCQTRLGAAPSVALDEWRTNDGGFHRGIERDTLSIYDTFLAWMAGASLDAREALGESLECAAHADGSFSGSRHDSTGAVPPTAAACMLFAALDSEPSESTWDYLERCRADGGGWHALPDAPMADLLSTATVLHALRAWNREVLDKREAEDFVLSLFDEAGGFHASHRENTPDVEYTFYGLLALACLAA